MILLFKTVLTYFSEITHMQLLNILQVRVGEWLENQVYLVFVVFYPIHPLSVLNGTFVSYSWIWDGETQDQISD